MPLSCFTASPSDSCNCEDWLADPSMCGYQLHQSDRSLAAAQEPGCYQLGRLNLWSHLLALPLLGSSHPAGLERGCRGFPYLALLEKTRRCWIPASVETMVAAEEVVTVFGRERQNRLTAAHRGRACQGKGTSYRNVFVYWGIALIYKLSAMLLTLLQKPLVSLAAL